MPTENESGKPNIRHRSRFGAILRLALKNNLANSRFKLFAAVRKVS